MKNLFKIGTLLIMLLVLTTGCSQNRAYKTWTTDPYIQDTYNESINEIADQLLSNSRINNGDKIAISSFVDLHKLNKTTHFGRNLSESMFDELHVRGFNVVDIRGTKTLRVNANGEFFITRDISLLNKKRVENTYVLVGTYSKFGKGILLNIRIIDNATGDIISTARTIIDVDTCDVYENCEEDNKIVKKEKLVVSKRTISISDAGCSYVACPTNCYSGKCGYDRVKLFTEPKKTLGCK
ncbi:MAG: FlgO family outer membrane protein [Campylobacterota bacterium]|nr:FlgO family outer membrane protein [Campylobacterota bacterium]